MEWLLCGIEETKENPVDGKMILYLKSHSEIREKIESLMKPQTALDPMNQKIKDIKDLLHLSDQAVARLGGSKLEEARGILYQNERSSSAWLEAFGRSLGLSRRRLRNDDAESIAAVLQDEKRKYFSMGRVTLGGMPSIRKKLGLKQADVADALGVTKGYILIIETRRRTVSIDTAERIAEILGVDYQDLLDSSSE